MDKYDREGTPSPRRRRYRNAGAAITVGSATMLVLAACSSSSGGSSSTGSAGSGGGGAGSGKLTLNIGFVDSETSQLAQAGTEQIRSAQIAVKDVNAAGGITVKLKTEDDQGTVAGSVAATQKVLSDSSINAFAGFILTADGDAATPVLAAKKIPSVLLQVTSIPNRPANVFSMGPPQQSITSLMMNQVVLKQVKSIGIIYAIQTTLSAAKDTMVSDAKSAGVKVTGVASSTVEATDYSSQVAQILSGHPDAVGIDVEAQNAPSLLQALRSRGFKGLIFSEQAAGTAAARKAAGSAAEGMVFGTYWDPSVANANAQKFLSDYKSAYPTYPTPDIYGLQAWDAIHILAQAAMQAKSTSASAITNQLTSGTFTDTGLQDQITFDSSGFAKLTGVVLKWEGTDTTTILHK